MSEKVCEYLCEEHKGFPFGKEGCVSSDYVNESNVIKGNEIKNFNANSEDDTWYAVVKISLPV